jgi:uncharacterized protein YndB with AHSA1/START domain
MTTGMQNLSVTKSVTVRAPRTRAFAVFTEKFVTWWPASHHIGAAELADAIIEPEVGGRWYERGVDGSECDWGRVLAYDPPDRIVLSWHLQGDWTYDPDPEKASEVEVRFVEDEPGTTRVELAHRHIERHAVPEDVYSGVDAPGGWSGILESYALSVV